MTRYCVVKLPNAARVGAKHAVCAKSRLRPATV